MSQVFPQSTFFPFVVGLFGLGTCYFVWGGQGLFGERRERRSFLAGAEPARGIVGTPR